MKLHRKTKLLRLIASVPVYCAIVTTATFIAVLIQLLVGQ